jgi:hypothetical protein
MPSRLLRIASSDKVVSLSESNSRFTVSLNNSPDVQRIKEIAIVSVSFPNVFPNVQLSDLTNTLYLLIDNGGITEEPIILDPGFYNVDDIIAALEEKINPLLAPSVLTITQVSNFDSRLRFTITGGATIAYTTSQGDLHKLLGISTDSNQLAIYTADTIVKLNGVTDAYVHSKVLAKNHLADGDGDIFSVLVCCPVQAEYGFMNYYQSPDLEVNRIVFKTPRNVQKLEIRLRDQKGAILDVGPFNELIVVLRIFWE